MIIMELYECKKCGKLFVQRTYLRYHTFKNHVKEYYAFDYENFSISVNYNVYQIQESSN